MKCRRDLFCQLFTQLNAPLIVGIDTPHATFNKGDVLVQRDQFTQDMRIEFACENRGRRASTLEYAGICHPFRRAFLKHLFARLAKGKCLRLSKEVREEKLVHILRAVFCGVKRIDKRDEVGRNQARTLVNELVEGVLTISSRFSPENLARLCGDVASIPAHRFTI